MCISINVQQIYFNTLLPVIIAFKAIDSSYQ